jgi:hypothetical protein
MVENAIVLSDYPVFPILLSTDRSRKVLAVVQPKGRSGLLLR